MRTNFGRASLASAESQQEKCKSLGACFGAKRCKLHSFCKIYAHTLVMPVVPDTTATSRLPLPFAYFFRDEALQYPCVFMVPLFLPLFEENTRWRCSKGRFAADISSTRTYVERKACKGQRKFQAHLHSGAFQVRAACHALPRCCLIGFSTA